MTRFLVSIVFWFTIPASAAHGSLVWYITQSSWQNDIGSSTMVDFGGFQNNTILTNQYADVGITFTNNPFIQNHEQFSGGGRLVGLDGIWFTLDAPHHAVGANYWGAVAFSLFLEGEHVATASYFSSGFLFPIFAGVVSDQPFDEIYLFKQSPPFSNNNIVIDDLFWGAPIPAPGALGMFALAALGTRRRRR